MSQAIEAHRKAVDADLQTMASTLVDTLGRAITAYIVHVRNVKTVSRWANGEVSSIRDRYSEERLLAAYQIVTLLLEYNEPPSLIRAFMLGMNPSLDDESPATELRNGNYKDVMGAANLVITGDYA